jgi:hypothetical protein
VTTRELKGDEEVRESRENEGGHGEGWRNSERMKKDETYL